MSDTETLELIKALARKVAKLETREHHHPIINLGAHIELTIAGGVVTRTQSNHIIDTQADAGTDDLDTINGGVAGDLLILRAANDARTVVVKDAIDNLYLEGDCALDNTQDTLMLICVGGNSWYELSRSNNAA